MHASKQGLLTYLIRVKGKLANNWADLFNEATIDYVDDDLDGTTTVLTCQVRDQAELSGILNWIQSMNLILLDVSVERKEN